MAIPYPGASAPSLPYDNRVRHVQPDQAFKWLAAGWDDFLKAPAASLAYGLLFVVIGAGLTLFLTSTRHLSLVLPMLAGFMLLGPVLTIGFQAMSRDIEQFRHPNFLSALSAWRGNAGSIVNAALAFMFLFLVFLRLSEVIFALTFPAGAGLAPAAFFRAAFLTRGGLEFLGLFTLFGAVVAALAFAGGAFALPMLIDRDVRMGEAIATSFTAVTMNIRAMALWAVILVALVAAGMALGFVGLAVTLPIAGHSAWHAYRDVIKA